MTDFLFHKSGDMHLLTPVSNKAFEWATENLEGKMFSVGTSFHPMSYEIKPIFTRIFNAGMTIDKGEEG